VGKILFTSPKLGCGEWFGLGGGGVKRKVLRVAVCATAVMLLCTGLLVWAFSTPMPPSLYKPELKRNMTQEERWKLDFDLANEITAQVNSRRFNVPDAFEKRAQWVEQEAVTYQIADLIQQILNDGAFNQLVALGETGDVSASCMANLLYNYHRREDITRWKHSPDDVARMALKAKAASGHPVCAGMESRFYLRGEMGYPMDRAKAKPYVIEGAVAGFWADQAYLKGTNLIDGQTIDPKKVERLLCWTTVADRFSPASNKYASCYMFSHGPAFNLDSKPVLVPQQIKDLARKWCEPESESSKVTAQDCANLERQ
jgi:hypothetical protein